ncbi:Nif3-like dinuclear metal center hexameric protein [Mesobacillus zeae]|uniref:GTP cyclohydrolase 1 type 2 homolog n=1 Tax=Mesobacillus zeae TaxID=1917180 RepID=A0A398B2E8_9BACI|nr:Nif3-like dinuclear metal center hexameric protein [Mesobacillus zeae]RID83821.1 Nif3-like dinuclear metal center hexameric protein [Mesobacillus zeae]
MKKVNGHEIIALFEQFAPKAYAMEGDKVGLQVGSLKGTVKNVMVTLDVLEDVIDEAIEKNVQLIIAHHPPIFRPLQKVTSDTAAGRIVTKLIKHDIAVYAAHTNLDVAPGGVNDLLASALGLRDAEVLVPTFEDKLKKLVVYVPNEHAETLREALGRAGAGAIGDYSHCSFSADGTGRFLPGEGTNPYIGEKGKIEAVGETRIETIYPESIEKRVLGSILRAHPYEEAAYDVYHLGNKGEELGLGRIGKVDEMTLQEFAEHVKQALDVESLRVVGDLNAKINKVAVLGGDGNKYFSQAKFRGADVYVTGDIYYHTAHDALMAGLNMVDSGHHVEKVMKAGTAKVLTDLCIEKGYDVFIFPSQINTDPFKFL